ncbi:hypothetical protein CEXT_711861 [Caerostris extrusa]|uniref:Uncharacterized protein n=1 Tax=Caerostris extrusa TaxID=172846 RepID=A0AAV4SRT0_CAEEX|nr:hypothetical protein CEXT_711861 [Caerostris extrusa]
MTERKKDKDKRRNWKNVSRDLLHEGNMRDVNKKKKTKKKNHNPEKHPLEIDLKFSDGNGQGRARNSQRNSSRRPWPSKVVIAKNKQPCEEVTMTLICLRGKREQKKG